MAKRHDFVHGIEDDRVLNHPVIVEFTQVLDLGDTALVELEVVLLKTERNRLNHRIDDADDKIGVVPVDGTQQDCEQMNIAILDLAGLGEDLVEDSHNLFLLPMEPADLPENLAVVPLGQIRVDELADEQLHRRSLLLLDGRALRRVDIVHGILDKHPLGLADVLHRLLPLKSLQEGGHAG